jgi:putative Mg2+ transporter-C (MgtC) family protein
MEVIQIDWALVARHCVTMAVAYVLALPIAWDRERSERSAGLRTFPIVAIAACGFTLTGIEVLGSTEAESRVIQGLITGMGFIGGGAILKHEAVVHGTATAASLWATGAIGLSVALGRLEIALVLSAVTYLTLSLLAPVKERLRHGAGEGRGSTAEPSRRHG